ncbi:MAG: chitobiase/beta-hexosaminidase C-terminal domain-containing protein [Clostridium sp.]|nr:chitobiase/beta-hexosaminidase C-terminal domain-containing protein [Clostridium sp.]
MNCQNCGAPIPEDSLYCEQCGQDVHIVPDYDPKLEYQPQEGWMDEWGDEVQQNDLTNPSEQSDTKKLLDDTDSFILEDEDSDLPLVPNKHQKRANREDLYRPQANYRPRKRFVWSLVVFVLLALIGISYYASDNYFDHSYPYQRKKGNEQMQNARYEKALQYFLTAIDLTEYDRSERDIDIYFDIAECYRLLNQEAQRETWLFQVIDEKTATADERQLAYRQLLDAREASQEYESLHELLLQSQDALLLEQYEKYLAPVPTFTYETGTYDRIVPLKLTTKANGVIRYTTDGSDPNENSDTYHTPIFLDQGEHVVKAIFENTYGILSECVTHEYVIDIPKAQAPHLSITSGLYTRPTWIAVTNAKPGQVYYTTSGKDPTGRSTRYTTPIPMPLGMSHFKFTVEDEDGMVGEITDVTFELRLDTPITPEAALEMVALAVSPTLPNPEDGDLYTYRVLYAADIGEGGSCYIIAQTSLDETGNPLDTGYTYSLNIDDGTIHRLLIEQENRYTLLERL